MSKLLKYYGSTASFSNAYAWQLDGSNEYLYRSEADYRSGDSAGTISAWVKTSFNSGALGSTIFSTAQESSAARYLVVFILSGQVYIQQRDNDTMSVVRGSTNIADGAKHNIIVRSNGTSYGIDIDNVAESLTVVSGSNNGDWFADTSSRVNIAVGAFRRNTNISYYNGMMDELSVWSKELDSTERTAVYNGGTEGNLATHSAAANLVSWWRADAPADDMTGTTGIITDLSGSGHHLTPQNTESGDKIAAF